MNFEFFYTSATKFLLVNFKGNLRRAATHINDANRVLALSVFPNSEPVQNVVGAYPSVHAFLFPTYHIDVVVRKVKVGQEWRSTPNFGQNCRLRNLRQNSHSGRGQHIQNSLRVTISWNMAFSCFYVLPKYFIISTSKPIETISKIYARICNIFLCWWGVQCVLLDRSHRQLQIGEKKKPKLKNLPKLDKPGSTFSCTGSPRSSVNGEISSNRFESALGLAKRISNNKLFDSKPGWRRQTVKIHS